MCANDFGMYLSSISSLNSALTYTEEDANYYQSIDNSPLAVMSAVMDENDRENINTTA